MSKAGTSSEESTASSSARVRSGVPWPILLERAATALVGGDTAAVWKLLDDYTDLCGEDCLISTAKAAVLSSEAAVHEARRQRKKAVTDVLLQVTTRIEQARPRQDVIHALPNEILIEIGHHVIGEDVGRLWVSRWVSKCEPDFLDDLNEEYLDKDRLRNHNRVALTSVCRRWRAVFSLGEFWADLTISEHLSDRKPRKTGAKFGQIARLTLDAFLAKGGLSALDMYSLDNTKEAAAFPLAMRGRCASLRHWRVLDRGNRERGFLWNVWSATDTFCLEKLWVRAHKVGLPSLSWSPPRGLDVSSLTVLKLESLSLDVRALASGLSLLLELRLDGCYTVARRGAISRLVEVTFPRIRVFDLKDEDDRNDGEADVLHGVTLRLPDLADLQVYVVEEMEGILSSVFPLPPRTPYPHLIRLVLETSIEPDDLLAIVRRLPTLLELTLRRAVVSLALFEALGSDCCPALQSFTAQFDWIGGEVLAWSTIIDMVRSREEAAARGEAVTPLSYLDVGGEGVYEDTPEEANWLWAHLQQFGSYCPRPKHIPRPTIA